MTQNPTAHIPLIWTTKGNIPADSLRYETAWFVSNDRIEFVETFKLDGEVVRRNVHVNILKGEAILPAQAQL